MSDSHDERPKDGGEPEPGFALAAGVIVYGLMGLVALVWLWLRDRSDALGVQAIGDYGPFAASGVGLVVGILTAWMMAWATRRSDSLEELSSAAQRMFSRAPDSVGIAFVLIAAIAEELFFRLAVQDAFGLPGAVAIYVVLNSSMGGFRWFLFTVVRALALSLIVHYGFGLLGCTTANAVFNYLSLMKKQES